MATQRAVRIGSAVAIAALAGLLYWGSGRWPTGYASGGPLGPPEGGPAAKSTLRMAAFNIHSGIGTDDKCDLNRTASVLRGFDFVGLEEVDGDRPWRSNVAATIGQSLGMAALFSPTETHWWCKIFGNAFLTKVPVTSWERTPLPSGWHMAHRSVVHLTMPFGQQTLNVMVVHLGKKSDRAKHFSIATDMFKALPKPAVMMGDFNTRPEDAMMQQLLASGEILDPIAHTDWKGDRVDFVLTRGVRVLDAGLIQNEASDHPVAWIEAEVPQ
jgi:endonuclease/exonuclease/phosphatase family metal-dependent hydrolase